MLGTDYFVKIAKINSQQEKSICPNRINHQLVSTKHKNCQSAKNKLPQTFRATR